MQLSRFAPLCVAAVWAASTLVSPAWAHDEATLDAMVSAHGGQLRMAGIYHFELVVAPAAVAGQGVPVQVYVTDHLGQKINTAQASGSVSFVSGTHRTQVSLSPQGDNALAGSLAQRPKPGTQAVVSITPVPGQTGVQTRFTRLQAKPVVAGHKTSDHSEMPKEAMHQH